jgi:hypothetical protein
VLLQWLCFISKGRLVYTLNLIKGRPQMMSDVCVWVDDLMPNEALRAFIIVCNLRSFSVIPSMFCASQNYPTRHTNYQRALMYTKWVSEVLHERNIFSLTRENDVMTHRHTIKKKQIHRRIINLMKFSDLSAALQPESSGNFTETPRLNS